jgi:predicted DNA-binding transcriptional regulator YafY
MKTVSQTAAEFGVSVQTIYRALRALNSVKQEKDEILTEKINGVLYVTKSGAEVVKQRLTLVKQPFNDVKQEENVEIIFLREQNKALQEELATERAHSRDIANKLAEITRNQQILLGSEQSRTNPALVARNENDQGHPQDQRRGFFGKVFGKKK